MRQFREKAGLGQRAFGALIGISQAAVSQWERGHAAIDADELPRISQLLGVEPCDFFCDPSTIETVPVPSAFESAFGPPARAAESVAPPYGEGERIGADLAEMWRELPEPEREFLTGLVELRRRYRERIGGG